MSDEVLEWLFAWNEVRIFLHMVQLIALQPKTPSYLASFNPDWFYITGTGLPRLSWKRGR